MRLYRTITTPAALVLLAAGAFAIPAMKAAQMEDSPEVTQLLAEAQQEAVSIKVDTENMESFTRSKLSWQTYAHKLQSIREHVNNAGELHAKLRSAENSGSSWQQTAIRRIEPLLQEMADNTTATIKYLNDNQSKIHMAEFHDLVKANARAARDLEGLISDYVDYADAKEDFEMASSKVEINR